MNFSQRFPHRLVFAGWVVGELPIEFIGAAFGIGGDIVVEGDVDIVCGHRFVGKFFDDSPKVVVGLVKITLIKVTSPNSSRVVVIKFLDFVGHDLDVGVGRVTNSKSISFVTDRSTDFLYASCRDISFSCGGDA